MVTLGPAAAPAAGTTAKDIMTLRNRHKACAVIVAQNDNIKPGPSKRPNGRLDSGPDRVGP